MTDKSRTLKTGTFLCILAAFALLMALRFFDGEINAQDTTAYAFSYRYGFISRGLMGSVLAFVDSLSAMDLMTYDTIYALSMIGTVAFYVALFAFYKVCLDRCEGEEDQRQMQLLIVFLSIFAFGEFVTYENFGRLDVFLAALMLIAMVLLVTERAEWLIPILCALGMLIHQGFIFMNINIILVILFAKAMTEKDVAPAEQRAGRQTYYGILFAVTLLVASVLFLYFEFFSHANGTDIYEEVKALAKQLSVDGQQYAPGILNHEILGEGVFMDEWPYHVINYVELAEFLILFAPYLVIGGRFAKTLYSKAENVRTRLVYLALILGAWTVLPEMALKIDYGRYMYEVVFYYLALLMMLLTMGEKNVQAVWKQTVETVKQHYLAAGLLVVYPMILVPFLDVLIANDISMNLVNWLNLAPAKTW